MASQETDALIQYIKNKGIPYKVTDINTPNVHSKTSYHYAQGTGGQGLAVDFAGTSPGLEPEMRAIFEAFRPVSQLLAELIHNGPGVSVAVKNGVWGNGLALFGATVWAAHTNHVHVAVHKGTMLSSPVPVSAPEVKVPPMYDPPLQLVDACDNPAGPGAYGLAPDGGVFALGGAEYRGVENQPLGKDYWGARKAARIEVFGNGYAITDTAGERYTFP